MDEKHMFEQITEQSSLYDRIETKSTREILAEINREDQKVALAVSRALPDIEALIEAVLPNMQAGGRLFYIGAGTSGRLGVLDASEIPPTFGMPPTLFVGLIAGGDHALRHPVEHAEDVAGQAWRDMEAHGIGGRDSVIGIAASGATPYVLGGIREAASRGLVTGGITSNPGSPLALEARYPVVAVVGPEYITGSSRMKSGTAQKMILNMISTTLMIRMGRVMGNKMADMMLTNRKLEERGARILMESLGWEAGRARAELLAAGSVRAVLEKYRGGSLPQTPSGEAEESPSA